MDDITDNHTALVIDNVNQQGNWWECVYWYKADPIPDDFKFGSIDYWNHHYVRSNEI